MAFTLRKYCILISFILSLTIGSIYCAPAQIAAPTVDQIFATSARITFVENGETSYIITLEPRHLTTGPIEITNVSSPYTTEVLVSSTLYSASVRAVNSVGEEGPQGATTQFRTGTRLILGTPFSNAVDVFFDPFPQVTKWLVEYRRIPNGDIENTTIEDVFAGKVRNLDHSTTYEIRARPSEVAGLTQAEGDVPYSDWTNFTTEPFTIFGRVVLTNTTYTTDYNVQNSDEWRETSALLESAYSSVDHQGVTVIENQEESGGVRVVTHYRLEVENRDQNFTLSGSNFTNSVINNGSRPDGTTYYVMASRKYTLLYVSASPSSTCSKLVERFMVVSQNDGNTFPILLNVASASATTPTEDDSLTVNYNGSLVRDDGLTIRNVSRGIVLALTPKFFIRDCLTGDSTVSLYSEVFDATDFSSSTVANVFPTYTASTPSELSSLSDNVTFNVTGVTVTVFVPAVEFAIKYEVMNSSGSAIATLEEEDIDMSPFLKMEIQSLTPNTFYNFTIQAIRSSDYLPGGVTAAVPLGFIALTTEDAATTIADETTVIAQATTMDVSTTREEQITTAGRATTPSSTETTITNTTILETSATQNNDVTSPTSTIALSTITTAEQMTSKETSTTSSATEATTDSTILETTTTQSNAVTSAPSTIAEATTPSTTLETSITQSNAVTSSSSTIATLTTTYESTITSSTRTIATTTPLTLSATTTGDQMTSEETSTTSSSTTTAEQTTPDETTSFSTEGATNTTILETTSNQSNAVTSPSTETTTTSSETTVTSTQSMETTISSSTIAEATTNTTILETSATKNNDVTSPISTIALSATTTGEQMTSEETSRTSSSTTTAEQTTPDETSTTSFSTEADTNTTILETSSTQSNNVTSASTETTTTSSNVTVTSTQSMATTISSSGTATVRSSETRRIRYCSYSAYMGYHCNNCLTRSRPIHRYLYYRIWNTLQEKARPQKESPSLLKVLCRKTWHRVYKFNGHSLCKYADCVTRSHTRNYHPSYAVHRSAYFSRNVYRRPFRIFSSSHQLSIHRASRRRQATYLYRKSYNRNGRISYDPGPHYWFTRTQTSRYDRKGLDLRHSFPLYKRPSIHRVAYRSV